MHWAALTVRPVRHARTPLVPERARVPVLSRPFFRFACAQVCAGCADPAASALEIDVSVGGRS